MDYPLIAQGELFPDKPLCPICKKNKIFEPHNFVVLEGGAFLVDKRGNSIFNRRLEGYLDLIWHESHSEDVNDQNQDSSGILEIVRASKNGQFNLYFCSTECLRKFLNTLVDDFEKEVLKRS